MMLRASSRAQKDKCPGPRRCEALALWGWGWGPCVVGTHLQFCQVEGVVCTALPMSLCLRP